MLAQYLRLRLEFDDRVGYGLVGDVGQVVRPVNLQI